MPIYEYKCEKCGKVFERLAFASDENDSVECPECGGNQTKRQMSCFSSVSGGEGLGKALSSGCGSSGGFS